MFRGQDSDGVAPGFQLRDDRRSVAKGLTSKADLDGVRQRPVQGVLGRGRWQHDGLAAVRGPRSMTMSTMFTP